MAKQDLFSEEALEKLRSPDRLDMMLPIASPVAWVILVAVGVFLFSVLVWSIFGAFTVTATGMGLLMDSAGVVNVYNNATGKVEDIYVRTGTQVKAGDLIARVSQVDKEAAARLKQQGVWLAASDRDAKSRVHDFDTEQYEKNATGAIYSDYNGIVDEVMVNRGEMVSGGKPICTVRCTERSDELIGLLYIPMENGKRVEPGMTIQLSPNNVDVTESGNLVGVVRSVSQYPVTGQSVEKNLGNREFAQWISNQQGSALLEVRFSLVEDKSSPSGYLWTSVTGKQKTISPGVFCTGSIVIERDPPIEKVFYKISQWLRNR